MIKSRPRCGGPLSQKEQEGESKVTMFDAKSDYSLNKNGPDAIVRRSADGG